MATPTYELIAEVATTSGSSITVSNIPNTYRHLIVRANVNTTSNTVNGLMMKPNNVSSYKGVGFAYWSGNTGQTGHGEFIQTNQNSLVSGSEATYPTFGQFYFFQYKDSIAPGGMHIYGGANLGGGHSAYNKNGTTPFGPITSMVFATTGTFENGTIKIWGLH